MDPPVSVVDRPAVSRNRLPSLQRERGQPRRQAEWTLITMVGFVIFTLLKFEPMAHNSMQTQNNVIDLPSSIRSHEFNALREGFMEEWLHNVNNSAMDCVFESVDVTGDGADEWFLTIKPDLAPDFTLTRAWLKTEAPSAMHALKEIPQMYESEFNMGGKIDHMIESYYDQAYLGKEAHLSVWDMDVLAKMLEKASKRQRMKYRSDGLKIHDGADKYKSYIVGRRGIVIGSEDPWVEAILLHHGAAKLLTVEFGKIVSKIPQYIETMVPTEFTEKFLNNKIQQFDFGISFSSLEHDGLGRYGDVFNPIGDLQSMAKMLSVIKPGGLMFVAVPTGDGYDALVWNAHRIYGKHRLPKLFAGWKLIDVIGQGSPPWNPKGRYVQHLWVLQNPNGCKVGPPLPISN